MIPLATKLQDMLFSTLSQDVPLKTAGITGVYDFVPQSSVFPYLTIGDIVCMDGGTKTSQGQDSTFTIHTWWQSARTNSGLYTVTSRIRELFHGLSIRIDDTAVANCIRNSYSAVVGDPDGITRHGIQKFTTNLYEDNP